MRILYASTTPVPSFKANSIQTMRTANALAAAGVDTTVLAGRAGASPTTRRASPEAIDAWRARTAEHYELHEAVRLESFAPGRSRYTLHRRYVSAFVKLTARERFDLVYTRNGLLAVLALLRGTRALLEVHDLPQRRGFARALGMLTHRHGLLIGSPSRSLLRYWRRHLGAAPERLRHIPHGALPPVERVRAPAPEGLAILFVGSAAPGKGFSTVLDVAARTPEHRFHAVLSGDPDLPATPPPNLELHRRVPPPEVRTHYARADLLLLPVRKHTGKGTGARHRRQLVPLRAVEYLTAGAPILASDLWPVREALAPTGAARFCPPHDPEAWARAIRRLAADPELRERMGRSAARAASERYAWARRAETIAALVGSREPQPSGAGAG